MKKLIPDEKNWKSKLSKFFSNKGFYVVLAICIIIVVATAILVTTRNINSPDTGIEDTKIIPEDVNASQPSDAQEVGQSANSKLDAAKQAANATNGAISKSATSNAVVKFNRPLDGAMMKDYTRDVSTMAESKTMGDIRAHKGIDFKAEKLAKVRAVADGTVCSVEDKAAGYTIQISHSTLGLKTVYAGLSKENVDDISVGLKVKANDIIGRIGEPIQAECEDGPHLHFEVLKNGKSVDPTKYLNIPSAKSAEQTTK